MKDLQNQIANSRRNYDSGELIENEVNPNPIVQFKDWMETAMTHPKIAEPTAMTLATVDERNRPKARIVLLRGFSDTGFKFFTNYNSIKAQNLNRNPFAALTFFWEPLERQVRIEGKVEKTTQQESDEYFFSRPKGNRLGAWVSPQSQVIENREVLEQMVRVFDARFGNNQAIPRPDFWGGYCLVPDLIEFWQGRPSRLHDRIRYELDSNGIWHLARLAP